MILLILKLFTIKYSVTFATFQMLNNHMWLVDSMLNSADIDYSHHSQQHVEEHYLKRHLKQNKILEQRPEVQSGKSSKDACKCMSKSK